MGKLSVTTLGIKATLLSKPSPSEYVKAKNWVGLQNLPNRCFACARSNAVAYPSSCSILFCYISLAQQGKHCKPLEHYAVLLGSDVDASYLDEIQGIESLVLVPVLVLKYCARGGTAKRNFLYYPVNSDDLYSK